MEDSLVEKGIKICKMMDQLIDEDKTFVIDKIKLYCKYCLSLNKDYVNSVCNGFYEECEDYLEKILSNNRVEMKKLEKQFISSCETTLAAEGREICKEVDSIIGDNDELIVEKASSYCRFINGQKREYLNPELVERCQNYIDDLINFNLYKSSFNKANINRKEKESWLDMRHMKLNGNIK